MRSRVPLGGAVLDGTRVVIDDWHGPLPPVESWGDTTPMVVCAWIEADEPMQALDQFSPILEFLIDDLSFQVQVGLKIMLLDVVDVTEPVAEGDTRDCLSFPFPGGYSPKKLFASVHLGAIHGRMIPKIPSQVAGRSSKAQDAVDWYMKSLHVGTDADQFILLWICLEILADLEADKVIEPTILRCKHTLRACPQCDKPTDQFRQGATLRKYLSSFDLGSSDVADLWWMRQLVHGARSFDNERLDDLGRLVQVLRSVVVLGLKRVLGMPMNEAPAVAHGQSTLWAGMAASLIITIGEWELLYRERSPAPSARIAGQSRR